MDPQGGLVEAASTQQAGDTRKRAREDGAEDGTAATGAERAVRVKKEAADRCATATADEQVVAAASNFQSTASRGAVSSRTEAQAAAGANSNREEEEEEEEQEQEEEEEDDEEEEEDDDDGLEWE
jgi:hypothetical protein